MKLDLTPFRSLIRERCGLLFDGNNEAKLVDALKKRFHALGLAPAEYHARLSDSENEFQELVNLLTINETYFFREPEQIRLLVDRLAPRMLAARGNQGPVRILSAGCSSGEEPYSLAMALIDKYGESVSRLFAFSGCDIDSTVLSKAREAQYTEFSFRGVPAKVRTRHFDKDRQGNFVKDAVKRLVSFRELNLLAGVPPADFGDFDIVFFRNVSIYFDTPTRKTIQQNIAALMKNDGVLVVGAAETLANDLGVLPLVEEDGLFYFVKGEMPIPAAARVAKPLPQTKSLPRPVIKPPDPASPISPLPTPPGVWKPPVAVAPANLPGPSVTSVSADIASVRQLIRDQRLDEAIRQLDAVLAREPGKHEASLLKAHVLIDRKDFAAADALAESVLAVDNWSIDAMLLRGMSAKWRQQDEAAIRWFKQAVYACQECWPAHYYLADLYRATDQVEQARRTLRVVMRLLTSAEPDTGIKFLPLALPAGEIRFLCERQLAKLPAAKAVELGR